MSEWCEQTNERTSDPVLCASVFLNHFDSPCDAVESVESEAPLHEMGAANAFAADVVVVADRNQKTPDHPFCLQILHVLLRFASLPSRWIGRQRR